MATRTAVVTGVSSGLGLELALRLLETDWKVVGVSRRESKNPIWQRQLRSISAHHIIGDVSEESTVDSVFKTVDQFGNFRLLINCAGQGVFGPAGEYTAADITDVLRGNLVGMILFCEAAFRRLKVNGGDIVNVMSTSAQVARANETIYCASKWGARGYTESLRLEAKNTPVNIIAVYPGGMKTSFWDSSRGRKVDCSHFMAPEEAAGVILDVLRERQACYISDITINRR